MDFVLVRMESQDAQNIWSALVRWEPFTEQQNVSVTYSFVSRAIFGLSFVEHVPFQGSPEKMEKGLRIYNVLIFESYQHA